MKHLPHLLTAFLVLALSIFSTAARANNICSNNSSTASSGSLTDSGGSGGNYSNNENCSFLIQPSGGGPVTLSFSQFNYESGFDFVRVYNGTTTSAPQLGNFTNNSIPADVTANSGSMLVVHSSDTSITRNGFQATWSSSSGGGGGSCAAESVADNFNNVSYNQNNGSQNWSTDWLEMGESDGVNAGISRVRSDNCPSGNCLRIGVVSGNPAQTYSSIGAQREVNLSGASSATLTFNYRTGYASGTPLVRLWVSNNGGASWVFLQQYSFTSSSFSNTAQSFDLTPYISSNTRIRFSGTGSAAVSGFYVDNINISYTGSCSSPVPSTEWQFDEPSWNGTVNEIQDSIGSFHGTAFNASTVPGQVCRAADLSSNSTTDYLSMDSNALNNVTDFTISVWGKTPNSSSQALFSVSSGSQHNELIMWFPNSSAFVPFLKGSGSGSISISDIADDNWHHFVWTRNGTQNCFYMDGVLQGCSTKSSQALSVAAGGLIIGQEQDSLGGNFATNQDWEGLVDEPLIFKSALSQAEITAIYNNQSSGKGWNGAARSCPSLIAEWRMNEPLWTGTTGEVSDATGNGHNGTTVNDLLNSDTSPALTGNPGTCRYGEFDGSNDYISLGNPAGMNFSGAITMTAWIRPDSSSGLRNILSHGHRTNPNQEIIFRINNGTYQVGSRNGSDHIASAPIPTGDIGTGTWTHLASVYDGTTWRLFRNGVQVASNTAPVGAVTIDESWAIGARGTGTERFFDGGIDEVRLYRGALSSAKINQIMNERHPCSGTPRAEWRFDEESWDSTANEILDSGANGYHGTAFNSAPTTGLVCNAADLSTNSSTDYLSLNNDAFNGLGDFTLSLWANTSTGSSSQAIVSGSSGSQHNELIMWFPNASTFQPYLKGSGSGGSIAIPSISDGQWHHYVWTRSGSQNCLYRDGISQGCVNRSSATLSIASGGLIIGQEQDNLGGNFSISQDFEGLIDEMLLFDGALTIPEIQSIYNNNLAGNNWNGASRDCGAALDHFNLNHAGSALTCAAETITLSAHQSDHSVDTSYIQTVSLTTSTNRGDWSLISGNGTLNNGSANNGAATYDFVAGDNGSVQLGLSNTTVEVLNINVTDGSISEASGTEDQDLSFKATGLRFLANNTASAIGTQISGKNSNLAPGSQTLELQAIRTDASGTCEAALSNNHSIDLAYECINPSTCSSGSLRAAINGISIEKNNSGPINNYQPIILDFGDATDSTATFTLNYPDAGQIRLHASYDIPGTGLITGSSNSFVVKPAGLCVKASSSCLMGNASCGAFKKAGEAFNLEISGVGWQASGESNADFCVGNNTTPNFQLNNISLVPNLIAPSSGINANLGVTSFNLNAADNGAHNITDQSLSEVGVFTLTATPPNYLGETIAASNSANIGRFYPDHFSISAGVVTEACDAGGFSYLGENFTASYGITAKNTAGTITNNYRDGFIRISPLLGSQTFGAIDNSGPTLLSGRLTQVGDSSFSWNNNGTGTVTSTLRLNRLNTGTIGNSIVDGPFTAQIGVLPTDADLVTVKVSDRNLDTNNVVPGDHVLIGSSVQRFGRIIIDNAFGPEILDLQVPLRAEFWSGSAFITNSSDNPCPGSQFVVSEFAITDANNSDSLTPASVPSVSYQPLMMGSAFLTLEAPNASGPLNINLNVPDWLKFDFDGNTIDDIPSSQAIFGQYRGNDRIIFWREL